MAKKKTDEVEGTPVETAEGAVEETAVEAAPVEAAAEEKPKKEAAPKKAKAEKTTTAGPTTAGKAKVHERAEKIGIVASDQMMKTVTVRVDRLVKHPVY